MLVRGERVLDLRDGEGEWRDLAWFDRLDGTWMFVREDKRTDPPASL